MDVIQLVKLFWHWKSISGARALTGTETQRKMVICQGVKGISDIMNVLKVDIWK